jgi:hypothetical protein
MGLPCVSSTDTEVSMRVRRVRVAGAGGESWTVLGEDGGPVEPVERFLAYWCAPNFPDGSVNDFYAATCDFRIP